MERLKSVPLSNIEIDDGFWNQYIALVQQKMLPYQWRVLNDQEEGAAKSHCIENFRIAAGESSGEYYGMVFQDTDVAKWIEALAYSIQRKRNPELEKHADEVIDLIGRAQHPDGYLNTYYTVKEPGNRWSNLREGHELYTAGHMIEAAVAYYSATGKNQFLNIVCRLADCICRTFGEGEEQIQGCPGHPEIELALVRLYQVTEQKRYLEMAKYFIDIRGNQKPDRFDEEQKKPGFHHIFPEFEHLGYNNIQAHMPVREQDKADGHAVRALYLYSAMADIGYEYQDQTLMKACRALFDNIVNRQMFVTGSVGAAADGECFTCDYDLPNNYNYSETCASIALAMFAQRMLSIERDGKYADIFERTLYNGVLSGMALNGTEFFYVNPLETVPEQLKANRTLHHVLPHRRKWMGVACCPPNIARTITSLGNYIYQVSHDTIFLNLFISGKTVIKMNGHDVTLILNTKYPYEGNVQLKIENPHNVPLNLAIREPEWGKIKDLCTGSGILMRGEKEKGYIYLRQDKIKETDFLSFEIEMEPMLVAAHPRVRADVGKAAIVKGPLVYCLEEIDNGKNLGSIVIKLDCNLQTTFDSQLFGGINTISTKAFRVSEEGWDDQLYRPASMQYEPCSIKAIPYCMWNNRGIGEMLVWIHSFF